tara:strand:- start:896 stop:1936 length:1041 start_codon:yes stop_codon:yes gene_type:complete
MILSSLVLAAMAPAATPMGDTTAAVHVDLKAKASRKWEYELPAEQWLPVGTQVTLAGRRFEAKVDGEALLIDTDGDGELERRIEGREDRETKVHQAFVTLQDEFTGPHSLRLTKDRSGNWFWATSCIRTGKIDGQKVTLIDQNGDGLYGQPGVDAMIVGSGKVATFQSDVVRVGEALYAMTVDEDGTGLSIQPFEGATGMLDLATDLTTDGKLVSAIVVSEDKRMSFDLALFGEGQSVPAGTYEIHTAKIGLGSQRVSIDASDMEKLDVEAGEETNFSWGGPTHAEFAVMRQGDELVIDPYQVYYYGEGGEEYVDWLPLGKSPEFTITYTIDGNQIEKKAVFPPNC